MVNYTKLRSGKENKVYNVDKLQWYIEKYRQRINRKVKAVIINSKPLTKRDKVAFKCIECGKDVELFSDKFVKRNGEKFCRECAIIKYHERYPNWLVLTDEQKKAISKRNSGPRIKKYETRICPVCGKEFKVRLTAHNKNKKFCSKTCNIQNYSNYGKNNCGQYGYLGIVAVSGYTKPELYLKDLLENNKVNFKFQKYVRVHTGTQKVFDFWLPDYNTFIEVDGDYWHYNKNNLKIIKKPPNKIQLKKIESDRIKNEYCSINSIKLIRIWASELEEKAEEILEELNARKTP